MTTLQVKACGLLGAWSGPDAPSHVRVGDLAVDTGVVALAAALEITVHGWDVGQSTGHGAPIPEALAEALLPVANALVSGDDRESRFADPVDVGACASRCDRLLSFLGRRPGLHLTGPLDRVSTIHRTDHRSAS